MSEVVKPSNALDVNASARDMTLGEQEQARRKAIIVQRAREGYSIGEQCILAGVTPTTHRDYRCDDPIHLLDWQKATDESNVDYLESRKEAQGRRRQRAKFAGMSAQVQLVAVAQLFSKDGKPIVPQSLIEQAKDDPQGFACKAAMAAKIADELDARAFGLNEEKETEHPGGGTSGGVAGGGSAPPLPQTGVRDWDAFLHEDCGIPRGAIYRRIVWMLKAQEARPHVRRVLFCAGKGSGKGTLCSLVLARDLQRLFCATSDELTRKYDLGPLPKVGVINLSASGEMQAQMAIFTDVRRWLGGPWFKASALKPARETTDMIEWRMLDRTIIALSGNSSSAEAEGVNWVSAAADEVCRLPERDTQRVKSADALVAPVESTMVTRFGSLYHLVVCSWPEADNDYLHKQIARVRDAGGEPNSRAGVAEDLTAELLAEPLTWEGGDVEATRQAALREKPFCEYTTEAFLTRDGTLVVHGPVWAFKPRVDLEGLRQLAARDLSAFSSMAGARPKSAGSIAYLPDPEIVRRLANKNRKSIVDELGRIDLAWQADPSVLYFAHLDGAARHDCAGLAVAHWGDGKVVIDLLMERRAPKGGELDLDSLREPVHEMQRRGATFAKATTDGWMGIALQQGFKKSGIRSEPFSVDRDRRAYDTWRDALMQGVLDYAYVPGLFENAKSLVVVGKKVDHTSSGRKDLLDAMSAVVFHVIEKMGRYAGIAIPPAEPTDEKESTQ